MTRWCHFAAQFGDEGSDMGRTLWELFVRRGVRWKVIHDPKFASSRNRVECALDMLADPGNDEFATDVPRDPSVSGPQKGR